MKGCIIATVVLGVVLTLVAVNAIYVRHVSATLSEMTDALPSLPDGDTPAAVQAVGNYLDRHISLLSLSINYTLLARAGETVAVLKSYAEASDAVQYAATMETLRQICRDLARAERFHVKNLL